MLWRVCVVAFVHVAAKAAVITLTRNGRSTVYNPYSISILKLICGFDSLHATLYVLCTVYRVREYCLLYCVLTEMTVDT